MLYTKSRRHLVGATLDLTEQSLKDLVGANGLPMLASRKA
jgi:hypothetical protein